MSRNSIANSLIDELDNADVAETFVPDAAVEGPVIQSALKAELDKQPKRRVGPYEYGEVVQLNGLGYVIKPDEEVMVPQSIYEILENKRIGERYVKGINDRLRKRAQAGAAAAVEYIR